MWYAVPSIVALVFKFWILVRIWRVGSDTGRVLRMYLVVFSLQNLCEVSAFIAYYYIGQSAFTFSVVDAYMVATVTVLFSGLLFAASIIDWRTVWLSALSVAAAAAISALILFTDWIVAGYQPNNYIVITIRGPHYWIFTTTVLTCLVGMAVLLGVGTYRNDRTVQARSRLMLAGLAPVVVVGCTVVVLRQNGYLVASAVVIPFTLTFFLLVTAYALTTRKLLDIRIIMPGTNAFRRFWPVFKELATISDVPMKARIRNIESTLVMHALEQANGVQSVAARELNVSSSTLHRKLKEITASDTNR